RAQISGEIVMKSDLTLIPLSGIIIISNEGAGCDLEIMESRESSLGWIVTCSGRAASFVVPRAEEGGS
ncbi:hypothetical protein PanWU01x14_174380, partial [Parasponia andersonii]